MTILTPRQIRVIVAIARGRRYREIAESMGVGIGTVSNHRKAALVRLGLRTNADLVRYCYGEGWIG